MDGINQESPKNNNDNSNYDLDGYREEGSVSFENGGSPDTILNKQSPHVREGGSP
jgi:hypothetical protein